MKTEYLKFYFKEERRIRHILSALTISKTLSAIHLNYFSPKNEIFTSNKKL